MPGSAQPDQAVEELHARATRLLRLGTYMAAASSRPVAHDPLARLTSEYQSYLVGVRNLQYDSVQSGTTAPSLTALKSAGSFKSI